MKRSCRSIFVFGMCAVTLAGPGTAGCVTDGSLLEVHMVPQPGERTIPIRVGVLPPIDARPKPERSPPFIPRASLILITPVYYTSVHKGARWRHNFATNLGPAPDHAFGNDTVVDFLGSHALGVIRGTKAFEHIEPVHERSWSFDQLPRIARQTGLRYLLSMEVRHFYALRSVEMVSSGALSWNEDVPTAQNAELRDENTYSFDSTVIRFRLFEVDGDQVRVFWQMSTRANQGSVGKEPREISGSETVTECLRQLASGLDELTRLFVHDAQVGQ